MPDQCPYCGDSNITASKSKDLKKNLLYTCPNCRLSFFFYSSAAPKDGASAGSKDKDERGAFAEEPLGEEEAQELALKLMQKQGYDEACRTLDRCPSPWQHPLMMHFLRFVGELGKAGGLTEANPNLTLYYKQLSEINPLNMFNANLRNIDYYLPKNDPKRLYETYCGLYRALLAFAALPVDYYISSTDYNHEFQSHGLRYYKRCRRTENWMQRALALGHLARRLEEQGSDSSYGDKYREMSVSLWSACAEYERTNPPLQLSSDVFETVVDRIVDYFFINKQENKLRRQIQDKLSGKETPVELVYQPKNRKILYMCVHAVPAVLLLIALIAVWVILRSQNFI